MILQWLYDTNIQFLVNFFFTFNVVIAVVQIAENTLIWAPRTGGSVGWALDCHGGGLEFDSGRINTQGLKITNG